MKSLPTLYRHSPHEMGFRHNVNYITGIQLYILMGIVSPKIYAERVLKG